MLKIGLLGAGHLGKIHLKCIAQIPNYELVGFYDPNDEQAEKTAELLKVKRFKDLDELLNAVDVVDIVSPTITHFELAEKALKMGKHLFIEKPVTHTLQEGETLLNLSKKLGLKVQIGHVERFNPAWLSVKNMPLNPMFIEAHRLAAFNPRGTDVSVILDLMIHDLDIILHVVPSKVKSISASGVAVVSDTPDISNARIEFENGCVANLTASRISMKQMRKLRMFQKDAYISLDFLDKNAQVIRLFEDKDPQGENLENLLELETNNGKKWIHIGMPEAPEVNAIKMELETFNQAITNDTEPIVTIDDGFSALKVAYQIIEAIGENKWTP